MDLQTPRPDEAPEAPKRKKMGFGKIAGIAAVVGATAALSVPGMKPESKPADQTVLKQNETADVAAHGSSLTGEQTDLKQPNSVAEISSNSSFRVRTSVGVGGGLDLKAELVQAPSIRANYRVTFIADTDSKSDLKFSSELFSPRDPILFPSKDVRNVRVRIDLIDERNGQRTYTNIVPETPLEVNQEVILKKE